MGKTRLDQQLVSLSLFESRARAAAAIKAGQVTVNGITAEKASMSVSPDDVIEAEAAHDFVSRGALKLQKGLAHFGYAARNGGVAAFVSGDRHISAFYRSEPVTRADGTQEQFTELTVGSANAPWISAREQDALQISPLYVKTGSFSLIEIDPKAAEMRFAVMNDKGSRELLYKLPLTQSQNR